MKDSSLLARTLAGTDELLLPAPGERLASDRRKLLTACLTENRESIYGTPRPNRKREVCAPRAATLTYRNC